MVAAYNYDLPAQKDQLEAIGKVVAEWSYMESLVDTAIWKFAYLDQDTGSAITAHITLPNRLFILRSLYDLFYKNSNLSKKLGSICENISQLSRQRGETVHALWVRGDHGSPMAYTVRARGKLEHRKAGMSAEDITAVAASIAQCAEDLRTFLDPADDPDDQ